jgi:hypothetical protein
MDMFQAISDRLTAIEDRELSRPTQEPDESDSEPEAATATSLARDQKLASKVRGRMAELNLLEDSDDDDAGNDARDTRKSRGKKSGRAKTIQDIVVREIDWPQYHVYRGVDRRPAKYEDLAIQEFVYGFLCQILDGTDSKANKNTMLQHLRHLMSDACEYPWPNVRNFHGIVLSQLEMDRLTWDDQERIGELRQTYVQRGSAVNTTVGDNKKRYCLPFQEGRCKSTNPEHSSPQGYVNHICAYCLRITGYAFQHPEKDCIRKERAASKNERKPSD